MWWLWWSGALLALLVVSTYTCIAWNFGAALLLWYWPLLYGVTNFHEPDFHDSVTYLFLSISLAVGTLLYFCLWCCCADRSGRRSRPVTLFIAVAAAIDCNLPLHTSELHPVDPTLWFVLGCIALSLIFGVYLDWRYRQALDKT